MKIHFYAMKYLLFRDFGTRVAGTAVNRDLFVSKREI